MKNTIFVLSLSALFLSLLACSDGKNTPPVSATPSIDSSQWPVDPNNFGMTAEQYIQTESLAFFGDFMKRAGVNNFFHFTTLSNKDDTWVVSPNQDTLYSLATIDAKNGFTLSLPDVGDRFISIQIINPDHYTPYYVYGGGTHHFKREQLGADIVGAGIRIATDGTPKDVKLIVEQLQPHYKVIADSSDVQLPDLDLKTMASIRAELLPYYAKLDNTYGIMSYGYEEGQDDWRRAIAAAGAWGLSPDDAAMYALSGPESPKANACYKADFAPVPAEAFFSLTAYNSDKFLMTNEKNSVSSNRNILVINQDGSFTVYFGGEQCENAKHPNFILTPQDGWDTLLRAYVPDVKAFYVYDIPEYKLVK